MNQKSSLREVPQFVSGVLTGNIHGTDDAMPDAFDDWAGELDAQDVCDYAEMYGKKLFETYSPKKLQVQHLPSDIQRSKPTA
jgi:hypothetical protein